MIDPSVAYLQSVVILFGVSALVVFLLGKIKISSVVGFLLAGLVMGPYSLDIVKNVHEVEKLAELGVVLLMFTIGLEFSLRNLLVLKKVVFGAGIAQVAGTTLLVSALSYFLLGQTTSRAVFDGFLVALSSTAIVLKILLDRAELHTSYGRSSVGMLIFQDLCVVPFMLAVPILSGSGGTLFATVHTLAKAALVVGAILLAAHWLIPSLLHQVVSLKSRELFVITIVVICLGTALLMYMLGLSLALGAFLAGVVISESEYSSQAVADIMPFKESFTGLFFISVGMLLDLDFFFGHIGSILLIVLAIVAAKIFVAALSAFLAGQTLASSIQTGIYIAQIGEFSFILAAAGMEQGLIERDLYQVFLSASIVTMMMTPFMMKAAPAVSTWVSSKPPLRYLEGLHDAEMPGHYPATMEGHVIIVGHGVNGTNIARVLKETETPYVILESDSTLVRQARRRGEPIYYGDAARAEILHKVGIERAHLLVVVISDPAVSRRIVQVARHLNRGVRIIVRTRLVAEVDHLLALGADEVVPEEFETSVEIFAKVLHYYHVPSNIIRDHVDAVRQDSYLAFRTLEMPRRYLAERPDLLKNVAVETYMVKEGAVADGVTLRQLNLRAQTGATIIGIERGEQLVRMPPASYRVKVGDVLFFVGTREQVRCAVAFLDGTTASPRVG